MEKKLSQEVWKRIKKRIKSRTGPKKVVIISFVALIVVNVIVYFVFLKIWDIDAANQQIAGSILGTLLLEAVLLGTFVVFWRFYDIPQEIYSEQLEKIKAFWPDDLSILVFDSVTASSLDDEGNFYRAQFLEVKNNSKKKQIMELEAKLQSIWQTSLDQETGEPMTIPFFPDERLLWENGESRINLRPDERIHLQLGFLKQGKPARMYFGEGLFTNHLFEHPAVYQISIQFTGKLEGETEFRHYHFMQVYYSDPIEFRITTGMRAVDTKIYDPLPEPFVKVIESAKEGYWYDFSSPFRKQQEKKRKEKSEK